MSIFKIITWEIATFGNIRTNCENVCASLIVIPEIFDFSTIYRERCSLNWIGPTLFESDEMDERDDYQRFKDDPPIEGRLLEIPAVCCALIKIILPSDHCNTLIMCDNSEMICIPGYGRHKAIKRLAISQPHLVL